jgi:hypothetical protein
MRGRSNREGAKDAKEKRKAKLLKLRHFQLAQHGFF